MLKDLQKPYHDRLKFVFRLVLSDGSGSVFVGGGDCDVVSNNGDAVLDGGGDVDGDVVGENSDGFVADNLSTFKVLAVVLCNSCGLTEIIVVPVLAAKKLIGSSRSSLNLVVVHDYKDAVLVIKQPIFSFQLAALQACWPCPFVPFALKPCDPRKGDPSSLSLIFFFKKNIFLEGLVILRIS